MTQNSQSQRQTGRGDALDSPKRRGYVLLEFVEGTVSDIRDTGQVTRLTVGGKVLWLRTSRSLRLRPLVASEDVTVVVARVDSEGTLVALRFLRQRDGYAFCPLLHSSVPLQIAASALLFARRRLGRATQSFARWAVLPIACWGFMHLYEQRALIRDNRRMFARAKVSSGAVAPQDVTLPRKAEPPGEVFFGLQGSAPSPEAPWWHSELLEHTQDAIIIWEMEGAGILYWNQAAEHLYGYTREEANGRVTHDLLRTITLKPVKEVESILARYGVWVGELRHTAKNGRIVEVEGRLSLMSQRNGRWLVLEVNRDMTDRTHAEATGVARETSLTSLKRAR